VPREFVCNVENDTVVFTTLHAHFTPSCGLILLLDTHVLGLLHVM